MGKRRSAIKSIRAFCIHCAGGDLGWIKDCPSGASTVSEEDQCPLYPYRMGKNPNVSEATRVRAKEAMESRLKQEEKAT